MKKILFLLLIVNMSFAQEVAIELTQQNIIIRGIQNPLRIALENTKCKDIVIKSELTKITKGNDCSYTLVTTNPSRELTINIFKIKGRDSIFVDKKNFRVKELPNPIPTIAGLYDGKVSEEKFKTHFSIGRFNSYSEYVCISFDVIEYTMMVVRNNQSIGISKNIGNRASEDTKQLIELVKAGDNVYIVDLKCKILDKIRELDEVKFEITQ